MKRTQLSLVIAFGILIIGVGVLLWQKQQSVPQPDLLDLVEPSVETPVTNESNTVTTAPIPEPEMVWYDIPELGIRFKVDPVTKEELVYHFVGFPGKETKKLVDFSTKTMTELEPECSAEKGAPLGSLSRRFGKPKDPLVPCGGGQKVYEYPGGYFCYTMPQAPCMSPEEDAQYQEVLKNDPRYSTPGTTPWFNSPDLWKNAEVY